MKTNKASLFEAIKELMIKEYINEYSTLLNLIKPTVGIKINREKKLSKFGGKPFFPNDFNCQNLLSKSLSLLCQLSVDEFKSYNAYNYLPNGGMLYFFVNPNLNYSIKQEDFKIIYISNIDDFFDEVDSNTFKFDELFIEFFNHYNFPSYQSYQMLELGENSFELDERIEEIRDFIHDYNKISSGCEGSQLFGNPQAIQGAVSFHWAMKALKLEHPLSDKDIEQIKELEKEFILLLQIDFSDIKIFEQFGDGLFYFGVRKKELDALNFDNVELVYQAT